LQVLTQALNANDVPLVRTLLKDLVPGYQPDGEVVDWVHLAQAKMPAPPPKAPAQIALVVNQ